MPEESYHSCSNYSLPLVWLHERGCKGPVHITSKKFVNAAVFLPTVHTNPSRKRSFSKMLFKPRLNCVLMWMKNILKTELFENDDVTLLMWFPQAARVFHSPTQIQLMTGNCSVKLVQRGIVMGGKNFILLRVNSLFSNFSESSIWLSTISLWSMKLQEAVESERIIGKIQDVVDCFSLLLDCSTAS